MKIIKISALSILAAGVVAAPAFAYTETTPPMAISIGVTFDQGAESALPLSTLSAAMATGGSAAVANSTAMVAGGRRNGINATTANGGAVNSYTGLTSKVGLGEGMGFESSVGTMMVPAP